MESKIRYVAKDGRQFDDAKLFEQYEQALDTDPHTIGYVVKLLRSFVGFVTGIIICEHEGQIRSQVFVTQCVDEWLKDYVDVESLTQRERYIDSSTRRCAAVLSRKFAPEAPCHYILIIGKDVDMHNPEIFYNCNPKLWKMMQKKNEAKKQKEVN